MTVNQVQAQDVADVLTQEALVDYCDLMTPYCVRAMVTVGLTEELSAGPISAEEAAAAHGLDVETTRSLLDYLAARQIVLRDGRGYELAGAAKVLNEPGRRLGLSMAGVAGLMDSASLRFPEQLTTGHAAFDLQHGMNFWQFLEANPDIGTEFDESLDHMASAFSPVVVSDVDWCGTALVVDVAGGTGRLASEITAAHTEISVIVVEAPHVASRAETHLDRLGSERVTVCSGDVFTDLLPEADTYLLCQVLHDWPDDRAEQLLKNLVSSAPSDGARLLVIDRVLHADTNDRVTTYMDLRMRLLFGAGERSDAQLSSLLARCGIDVRRKTPTEAGLTIFDARIPGP